MILDVLDADRSGTIEIQEFKAFVVGASKPEGKTANPEKRKVVIERLRAVFLGAEKKGLTWRRLSHTWTKTETDRSPKQSSKSR